MSVGRPSAPVWPSTSASTPTGGRWPCATRSWPGIPPSATPRSPRPTTAHETLQTDLKSLKIAVTGAQDATDDERSKFAQIERVAAVYSPIALAIVKLTRDGRRGIRTGRHVAARKNRTGGGWAEF